MSHPWEGARKANTGQKGWQGSSPCAVDGKKRKCSVRRWKDKFVLQGNVVQRTKDEK